MKQTISTRRFSTINQSSFKPSLLILTLALALTGCSSMSDVGTSGQIPTPSSPDISQQFEGPLTQCPPANPANNICTVQYEPVCVKTKVGTVISYRTASNACSACNIPEAVGYTKGKCN
ncbi:hypothetical protein FQV37_2682 [Psychrobacter nivimaris]|uniref:Kazal-like domain-containing protein n=1 Tax=Psychrobacter nivimaris TaxID=281738 RepID=A0A6N7C168_9GAMM|nr:hypothetical protein [Psychrobacter nivimaris]KAF0569655.1 hypothetical protein FQV37_2682 [Psychrobacter nivimaris]